MRWLVLALLLPAAAGAQPACEAAVTAGGRPPAAWAPVPGAPPGTLTETTRVAIGDRYALCMYPAPVAADLDVTLRFRPVAGRMDRAGGLAVRVADADNYYLVRANAAEDNVRLYHVTRGRRVQFAGQEGIAIAPGEWHRLRLRVEGDRFAAWFDGAPLFTARDGRMGAAGRVALWTIADSHTEFAPPEIEVLR